MSARGVLTLYFAPAINSRASYFPIMSTRIACRSRASGPYLWCVPGCVLVPFLLAQDVGIVLQTVPREVVAQRLERLHAKNAERETELKTMFTEAGCGM